jgi:hypothetical protein
MKKRAFITACAAFVLLAGAAALFFALYSRQVWLVDEWTSLLKERGGDLPIMEVEAYHGTLPPRARRGGSF